MPGLRSPQSPADSGELFPSLLGRRIRNNRYVLEQRLGAGASGVVYRALDLHPSTRPVVAVKCILRCSLPRLIKARDEIRLHRLAAAVPGVVGIYDVCEEGDWLFVVLDYYPGDMFSLVVDQTFYVGRDTLIRSVFLQLLDAVRGMHALGLFHRDVKPENILVNDDGSQIALADFGLATEYEYTDDFGVGSNYYMSPECVAGSSSSPLAAYSSRAADIWALGVLLVNMATGCSPWDIADASDESYTHYMSNPEWLCQSLSLSGPAFALVNKIFQSHGSGIDLDELREDFLAIDKFSAPVHSPSSNESNVTTDASLSNEVDEDASGSLACGDKPECLSSGLLICGPVGDDKSTVGEIKTPIFLHVIHAADAPCEMAIGESCEGRTSRSSSADSSVSESSSGPFTPKTIPLRVQDIVPDMLNEAEEFVEDDLQSLSPTHKPLLRGRVYVRGTV